MLSPGIGRGLERRTQTQGDVTFSVKSESNSPQMTFSVIIRGLFVSSLFLALGEGEHIAAVLYLALIGLLNRLWFSGF